MPRIRFRNAITRFHREEKGQLSFLAIAASLCFIALLAMVINSNDIVTERVHMQDVADVTALSSASWSARGLNMVSFINVMNTKLIATAVLLNALADAVPVIVAVGEIQAAIFQACSGVPFVGVFCAAMAVVVRVQLAVLRPLQSKLQSAANKISRCPGGKLWSFMNGLQKVATGVRSTFVGIGLAESVAIAKANGASFGIAMNGKLEDPKSQIFLPLKEGQFKDYCPKVMNGGPGYEIQKYECSVGPLKLGKERINKTLLIPFTNLLAHPIFWGMVMSHNTQIGCTNDPKDSNKIKVQLKDHQECKTYKATAKWSLVWSKTVETDDGSLTLNDFVPWKPRDNAGGSKGKADADKAADLSKIDIINIEGEKVEDPNLKPELPLGKGLALRAQEVSFRPVNVKCQSPEFPIYGPPPEWDGDFPGRIDGLNCFLNNTCDKITKFKEFTWYSGDHVKNGPKTVGGYFIRVAKRKVEKTEQTEQGEKTITTFVYVIEAVSLVSAGEVEMTPEQFQDYLKKNGKDVDTSASSGSTGCEKPKPWLLDQGTTDKSKEEFQNRLRFISFVYKDLEDDPPFWSTFFDQPPKRIMAYGQAQTYNYLSEDTFTQDWRVRLEQANLLNAFLKKTGLVNVAGGFVGAVNNH